MSNTERLTAAGWKQRQSGAWIHPNMITPDGRSFRRRLFTEAEALTLLDAQTSDEPQGAA